MADAWIVKKGSHLAHFVLPFQAGTCAKVDEVDGRLWLEPVKQAFGREDRVALDFF
jgi:hypothetical protein